MRKSFTLTSWLENTNDSPLSLTQELSFFSF
jgi:hypothetical protein